jgi:hypothetical protein
MMEDDSKAVFYTGLTAEVFSTVCKFVEEHSNINCMLRKSTISLPDQLFLCVFKLRHNIPFQFLALQRGVALSTITDMFWNMINLLYASIGFLVRPTDRECLSIISPPHFKRAFPNLTHIIDCFEIFIDQPKNLKARRKPTVITNIITQ